MVLEAVDDSWSRKVVVPLDYFSDLTAEGIWPPELLDSERPVLDQNFPLRGLAVAVEVHEAVANSTEIP